MHARATAVRPGLARRSPLGRLRDAVDGLVKHSPSRFAILVFAAGAFVIFCAGLRLKILAGTLVGCVAARPLLWSVMKEYQKQRVLTMIDPTSDPLGKGFHIIQSMIAVGSGGPSGKGLLQGTQTHLEFVPERTTDFIFAVFAEEFGFTGAVVLLLVYLLLIGRGLMISGGAATPFSRLLAGAVHQCLLAASLVADLRGGDFLLDLLALCLGHAASPEMGVSRLANGNRRPVVPRPRSRNRKSAPGR